jgi:hypothetical protein
MEIVFSCDFPANKSKMLLDDRGVAEKTTFYQCCVLLVKEIGWNKTAVM